ncbi:MAG: IS1-like element transposase [Candidatus Methylumidiphilus sp.]
MQSRVSMFRCKDCNRIFKTEYVYRAYEPGVKEQAVDMAVNGNGGRALALQTPPVYRGPLVRAQMLVFGSHSNTLSQLRCCTSFWRLPR